MRAKDLRKEPPRSPRFRIRDYVILARAIDKCRARQAGRLGEYRFNCPLDNALFAFKGVLPEEFEHVVARGATDEQIGIWLDKHGIDKTPEEIIAWSNEMEQFSLVQDPDRRAFFMEECRRLGLDPETTTLFDYLEADDAEAFPHLPVH